MKNYWLPLLMLLARGLCAQPQCPPQKIPGSHQVQKGETLYKIARAYQVNVETLRTWNKLENDIISPCQELIVRAPAPGTSPSPGTKAAYPAQPGPTHIVQPGETIEGIAALYGYTPLRLRLFNKMKADQEASTGMVLKTNCCECPPDENTAPATPTYYAQPEPSDYPVSLFLEQPAKTQQTAGGNDNGQPASYEAADIQAIAIQQAATSPPTEELKPGADFKPSQESYLSAEERAMTDEINLLRTHPAGYIPVVENYISRLPASPEGDALRAACNELKDELRKMKPLSLLLTLPCIYDAAVRHGDDQRKTAVVSHKGTDGSWPWDRVKKSCTDMADGNEIISSGQADARKALIALLADSDYPSRGHRRMLLSKEWSFLACHKLGTVGPVQDNWILLFGRK